MQHLTEEEIVSHYYRDSDAPPGAQEHLATCAECRSQYDTIRRVLALVNEAPVPERSSEYGEQVWNRLRWKLGSVRRRRRGWQSIAAVAAMLAVAFFAGQLWRVRRETTPTIARTPTGLTSAAQKPADAQNRILLVVLSDHLDTSERVLIEFVNSTPGSPALLEDQQKRAGELVSANRLYRATAAEHGNDRVTELLTDLEPILIEIANAGPRASAEKIAQLQKRIETKGLLFKVRVLGAHVTGAETSPAPIDSDTL